MELRDWFILILTFLMGLITGIYFYATVFAPEYEKKNIFELETEVPDIKFDIIGLQYGGLVPENYEYPSFRVTDDGSFKYTRGGIGAGEETGTLPKVLVEEVTIELANADVPNLSQEIEPDLCASYVDGTDYSYSLLAEDTEYELDTCGTAFSHDTDLGRVLLKLWRYMEAPNEYRISVSNVPEDNGGAINEDDPIAGGESEFTLNPIEYLERGLERSFGTEVRQ